MIKGYLLIIHYVIRQKPECEIIPGKSLIRNVIHFSTPKKDAGEEN